MDIHNPFRAALRAPYWDFFSGCKPSGVYRQRRWRRPGAVRPAAVVEVLLQLRGRPPSDTFRVGVKRPALSGGAHVPLASLF